MKYITLQQLERLGACESQVQRFRGIFGTKALVSKENLQKAVDAGLDVSWILSRVHHFSLEERIRHADIPVETRRKALEGIKRIKRTGEAHLSNDTHLGGAFAWSVTEEGHDFWSAINKAPNRNLLKQLQTLRRL